MTSILSPEVLPKPIRFVNNKGLPPSKRRRVNAACYTCRRRKTRCDGARPTCSTCTKNGHSCRGYGDAPDRKRDTAPSSGARRKYSVGPKDCGDEDEDEDEDEEDGIAEGCNAQRINQSATTSTQQSGSPLVDSSSNREHDESNRVPYFRYFGPTAIVPGFKQMVVNVPNPRRSRGGSLSGSSPTETRSQASHGILHQEDLAPENPEDLPIYDPNDPGATDPTIIRLIDTFFTHLGCNYPFLRREKFLKMVGEKRVEPILLDAILALAARFHKKKDDREAMGHFYAQRAKMATVDPFPCPTVGAVQAYLLLAYESFGQDQDSALWAYLQLAIGMSIDIGLPRKDGVKYQGEKDPWYTLACIPKYDEAEQGHDKRDNGEGTLSPEEQAEVEQERINTFWAVFVLDRVISSGTGRPVRFKDEDFEIPLPEPSLISGNGWPAPFPDFIGIIHLYGRVSDVLNNVRNPKELAGESIQENLSSLVQELTLLHQRLDTRLHFNAVNFQEYSRAGQGTTFILLHLWFHTLIIILHQPAVIFGAVGQIDDLLPNGREVAISSARSIADILSFAELIDSRSVIGNPFTSQPMYIAACAFLMQSGAAQSSAPSQTDTGPAGLTKGFCFGAKEKEAKQPSSLLAFGANQNYQRCYKSLQQLQSYWGGVRYILTALDQKSKGIWDCETYTLEEYAMTKKISGRRSSSLGRLPREFEIPSTPNVPPMVGFSLTGTTNSPNSSLTWVYQNQAYAAMSLQGQQHVRHRPGSSAHQREIPTGAATSTEPEPSYDSASQPPVVPAPLTPPLGNMAYDPLRNEPPHAIYTSAYPQAPVSAMRFSPVSAANVPPKPRLRQKRRSMSSFNSPRAATSAKEPSRSRLPSGDPVNDRHLHLNLHRQLDSSPEGTSQTSPTSNITGNNIYTAPARSSVAGYEPSLMTSGGRSSSATPSGPADQQPAKFEHPQPGEYSSPIVQTAGIVTPNGGYYPQLSDLTFDSREITWGQDPTEAMAPWLVEYFSTNDIIGLLHASGGGEENNGG
ncbi:pathway-specific nitrogen regulator [Pyricularia oryzae 70-15]|uniref:Pathway-specific nitrogen regulator n=2 Tax=Pyricularia oryzae TaxID=318829 RepID=G4NH49_PYRO7|nr:pathway-specific nitrogen regulator [Pyricularia oryzae 70-15]EHA47559.1 pathway-specific nitrogen regulator [Pyricularia oryzae 70-15]KAI7931976.1 pathway-specific nitrogen regulator [Pyricularia oryzae]